MGSEGGDASPPCLPLEETRAVQSPCLHISLPSSDLGGMAKEGPGGQSQGLPCRPLFRALGTAGVSLHQSFSLLSTPLACLPHPTA